MPDYLTPEDVPLDKPIDEETLQWLTNRNRHDLVEQYHQNQQGRSADSSSARESSSPEYDKWNVDQLKDELRSRLSELDDDDEEGRLRLTPQSGDRKQDLVKRLEDDDAVLNQENTDDDQSND